MLVAITLYRAASIQAQSTPGQLFDSTGAAPERPADEPPAYNALRYEEDYSYLRDPNKRTDYLDPLKFIPLDAAGRFYLTLGGDIGEFHYDVEGLYQFGRFGDAGISAFGASCNLGYYFQQLPFGPNLSLRVDVASGDDNPRDGTLNTFNPLFPKGVYFSEPGFLGPSNLLAVHPVVNWHLHKAVGLMTTVIGYWRQDTGDGIYNFGGAPALPASSVLMQLPRGSGLGDAHFVGTEANALLDWGINRHLTFSCTYSHFFAGTYARDAAAAIHAPGGRNGQSFDYMAAWLTFSF